MANKSNFENGERTGKFFFDEKNKILYITDIGVKTNGWKRQYKFNLEIPTDDIDTKIIYELAARELGRRYQASMRSLREDFISKLDTNRRINIGSLTSDVDPEGEFIRYAEITTGEPIEKIEKNELEMLRKIYNRKLKNQKEKA